MDSPLASPTKARQAAIQAKDWAFVNSWLNRHYAPNPIPKFERNEDTLRTLLALAAANEAADEEAAVLNHAREQTIEGFKAREKSEELQKVEILDEVEHCLDDTGAGNLEDLAETVAVLGTLGTKTTDVGQSVIELTKEEFEAQEQMRRVQSLHGYLERELITLGEQLDKLKSDPAFETPANLPALTSEWTRSTKLLNSKVNEYQDRTTALDRNSNKGATLEKVMLEEDEVGRMIESMKSLEIKIKMFHDLPKDIASARAKYQDLETELNQLTRERDSMFENLVDR
jgi:HAUS augmin-like complex subunit 1